MSRMIRVCKVGGHNVTPLKHMQWRIGDGLMSFTAAMERARSMGRDYMARNARASLQIWEYRNGKKYSLAGDTFGADATGPRVAAALALDADNEMVDLVPADTCVHGMTKTGGCVSCYLESKTAPVRAVVTEGPRIHAFNTGAWYTAKGQRIAWCVLSTGNAAMVDIDRGIDYILIKGDSEWTNYTVHNAYLENRTSREWNAERDEARDLDAVLRAAASMVAPNKQ